jgi:hypothetical protein
MKAISIEAKENGRIAPAIFAYSLPHDPIRKVVPTFQDHALVRQDRQQ